jgi:glycosyltransferase involved in cell wall biosynthesis
VSPKILGPKKGILNLALESPRLTSGFIDQEFSLVSVIIPCHNQAHFLGDAIESVLAQSYPNFEIIVVDDGSTDNTSEVAARYPGVQCIRQTNQRQAAARNTGLRHSGGNYLVFLDADDRLLPEALERGLACFEAHPECAMVAGHYRRIGADGLVLEEPPRQRVTVEYYTEFLRRNCIAVPGAVMYRRSVFEKVGDFDSEMVPCEDYDLYLRIARQLPIHCHEQVVAEYRQHGANVTSNPALMLQAALAALRSQWLHVQGNPTYRRAYKVGQRVWQDYYGEQLITATRTQMRERAWRKVFKSISMIGLRYPRGLLSLLFTYSLSSRIEEIVRTVLPANANVIIVSNDKSLKIRGCKVWHFSLTQNDKDTCSDGRKVLKPFEDLKERTTHSGDFLVIPKTSFWWLQRHENYESYLAANCRCIWSDERCIIYQVFASEPECVTRPRDMGPESHTGGHQQFFAA